MGQGKFPCSASLKGVRDMALVTTDEAKEYLRVDSSDEDTLIGSLLLAAEKLCVDVARLSEEQWADIDSDDESTDNYTAAKLQSLRSTLKVAVLYSLGYMFEHREEADHHDLTLTLRSLLFAIREGVL